MSFSGKKTNLKLGRIKGKIQPLRTKFKEKDYATVCGRVFLIETRITKNGKTEYNFYIENLKDDFLMVKMYENDKKEKYYLDQITEGMWITFNGKIQKDTYFKEEIYLNASAFQQIEGLIKEDEEVKEKRVELHFHSKYSGNSIIDVEEIVKNMENEGYSAFGIADTDCTHSFPVLHQLTKNKKLKVLYGTELTLQEKLKLKTTPDFYKDKTFVVFDIETTGLSTRKDEIIEIGAIKVKNGEIIDEFSTLVKPKKRIPDDVVKLTGITNKMVKDAPKTDEILPKFIEFIGDFSLVAHNIAFDFSFIKKYCLLQKLEIPKNELYDTLEISRRVLTDIPNHQLDTLCRKFNIEFKHHRAVEDTKATAKLFYELLKAEWEYNPKVLVYAKNQDGLIALNKIITKASLEYVDEKQISIPFKEILEFKEDLIIGSSGIKGIVFNNILNNNLNDLDTIKQFDFIEVYPKNHYKNLVKNFYINDVEEVINKMIEIGEENNIKVVATGDVHYFNRNEKEIWESAIEGVEKCYKKHADCYYRNTDEMLKEFDFLGEEKAKEVVVKNSNCIADMIEKIDILPNELFLPKIVQAEKEIEEISKNKLKELYGEKPNKIIKERYEKELNSILGRGEGGTNYAVLYWIAIETVKKSEEIGYMVGSRGSVGSSFLAYLCGISEVNPLPPHYRCPKCKKVEFVNDVADGFDLPKKQCKCGCEMVGEGHNIPFETFVGIGRIKPPDIDLNFSGDIQLDIHDFVREIFGEESVYRAGTIGTLGEKNIEKIIDDIIDRNVKNDKYRKYAMQKKYNKITGMKKTTGQHAGGLLIFPKDIKVNKIIPLQYSSNDTNKEKTTHWDYHAIEENFVKVDLLAHDIPTVLKMYENFGINWREIPFDDEETMELFKKANTFGITEFGTYFAQDLLRDYKPENFADLVRISGLSHGTNVWFNNGKDLIKKGISNKDIIACRDDIMLYLIKKGIDDKTAYDITNKVRKGKGVSAEYVKIMKEKGIPNWYIESCQKIKYLFPKAHATAYVMNAYRQAYVKVHYPNIFYAVFFTMNAKFWDWDIISETVENIENKKDEKIVVEKIKEYENLKKVYANNFIFLKEIEKNINELKKTSKINTDKLLKRIEELEKIRKKNKWDLDDDIKEYGIKEKKELMLLINLLECVEKGIKIGKVDIKNSHATEFIIKDDVIIPPFCTIKNCGEKSALRITAEREKEIFKDIEDFANRKIEENGKNKKMADKRVVENLQKMFSC